MDLRSLDFLSLFSDPPASGHAIAVVWKAIELSNVIQIKLFLRI